VLSRAGYLGPPRDDDPSWAVKSTGERAVAFAVPERLQVVDSTNRYLLELASLARDGGSEVPEGYAVVADEQSDGRGRLGRRWEAPAGSAVLCSILLRPDLEPDRLHLAAWAVALAAVQACRETARVALSLKWPNDLVAGAGNRAEPVAPGQRPSERKVAGILSEVLAARPEDPGRRGRNADAVVVGIGINVNWPVGWPPPDSKDPDLRSIAARATSLNRLAGRRIDRTELVSRLLRHSASRNVMLASHEGRQALASEYRLGSATIGREVRADLGGETVEGTALDIDDDGCLLVSTGVCIRTIAAGDIVHLR
jgi:BirA family biotin operon repressor/biotin-[acetyl-CoA-carboxylase] ligase